MMREIFLSLTLCLALAACSSAAPDSSAAASPTLAPSPQAHPESGLTVVPLTISGKGGTHRFRVELAASAYEQAKGLMFRTRMGPDEGMIFPMRPPRVASFWMKNTVIPLDMVFIGRDRRILNIEAKTTPYSEDPRNSDGIAMAVLELNGGRAAELGIAPGDKVEW